MNNVIRADFERKDNPADRRTIRTLTDWRQHSAPGDFARLIFAPVFTARAVYGAGVPMEFCDALHDLLDGGDVGLLNAGEKVFAVVDLDTLQTISGAA